jgi:hypothetical protein
MKTTYNHKHKLHMNSRINNNQILKIHYMK